VKGASCEKPGCSGHDNPHDAHRIYPAPPPPGARFRLREGALEGHASPPFALGPRSPTSREAWRLLDLLPEAAWLRRARLALLRLRTALGTARVPGVHHAPGRVRALRRHRRGGAVGGRQDADDPRARLVFSQAGRRCCRGARWPSASTRPGTPSSGASSTPLSGGWRTAISTESCPSASTNSPGKSGTSTSRSSTRSTTAASACRTWLATARSGPSTASSTCWAKSVPRRSCSSPATCGRRSATSCAIAARRPSMYSTASTSPSSCTRPSTRCDEGRCAACEPPVAPQCSPRRGGCCSTVERTCPPTTGDAYASCCGSISARCVPACSRNSSSASGTTPPACGRRSSWRDGPPWRCARAG